MNITLHKSFENKKRSSEDNRLVESIGKCFLSNTSAIISFLPKYLSYDCYQELVKLLNS